jgi:putative phage-type endonuclease
MKMTQINLIQGSQEWHEFRRVHIGSSDAPVIMGVSPYKTIEQLFKEKLTGESGQKEHSGMIRGRELEPLVLSMLNAKYSTAMEPCVFEHDEHKFISASLDGYDPVFKAICEIKCPNALDHKQASLGEVPAKYYPQLQHAMLVTGLNEIIYGSFHTGELITLHVARDESYIDMLLEQCKKFYASMQSGVLGSDLDTTIDMPDVDSLFYQMQDYKEKIKFYEEQLEAVKDVLLQSIGYRSVQTQRVKIKEVKRTSYDYTRLCDDFKIDKEPYKKTSLYWDIRERKHEN